MTLVYITFGIWAACSVAFIALLWREWLRPETPLDRECDRIDGELEREAAAREQRRRTRQATRIATAAEREFVRDENRVRRDLYPHGPARPVLHPARKARTQ